MNREDWILLILGYALVNIAMWITRRFWDK